MNVATHMAVSVSRRRIDSLSARVGRVVGWPVSGPRRSAARMVVPGLIATPSGWGGGQVGRGGWLRRDQFNRVVRNNFNHMDRMAA